MTAAYISVFAVGCALTSLYLFVVRPLAERVGYVDRPGPRKSHSRPVPYGGGVAIFLSLFSICSSVLILESLGLGSTVTSHHLDLRLVRTDLTTYAIAAGGVGIFLIGLLYDVFDLSALTKLGLQSLIALTVVLLGPRMSFFSPSQVLAVAGTVFWILLITNAFNLLDNMDGLSTSIAGIALGIHFILLHGQGHYLLALLTLLLLSSLVAFLFFNLPPARIYLGDAGSLLIGYIVAILSVLSTYYEEGAPVGALVTPILILAIPLYDV
ncbi:MAG: undecaprenyl/decaprenyl-phosphate alpha-N-acetylglucosaminyl 1-phosphate transferase, partial [Planctomycetes bacterium]|nr:undecaprenyl/decaprenyl-phosphate alpha-N-acetylglucosaminyl 1-phosphate transferase [Planctomycetota bacterium]